MIQIATVGDTQEVIKTGLQKILPEKLYILHTSNERTKSQFAKDLKDAKIEKNQETINFLKTKQYEDNVKKLKKEIQTQFKIKVELKKVDKFNSYDIIREIQQIVSDEKNENPKLNGDDFVINITGGTKAMVAGAACGAYLAQTKMYYVLHPNEAQGQELVRELPVPSRIPNKSTIKGSTEKTTSIILRKIWEIGRPVTNKNLLENLQNEKYPTDISYKSKSGERKIKTVYKRFYANLLTHHLNKLENKGLISRQRGESKDENKIDRRQNPIVLTETGRLYAAYPETIGDVL